MPSGVRDQSIYQEKLRAILAAATLTVHNAGRKSAKYWQPQKLLYLVALNQHTLMMAVKASIPPTVLVCAIQSETWIAYFKTNAYLAPIIAACALPNLPRERLLVYHLQLSFAFVLTYGWVLLAGWSGFQARNHSIDSLDKAKSYTSNAEAVVALFFVSFVWLIFTIKSAFPAMGLQCTLAGVFGVAVLPLVATSSNMSDIVHETNNVFVAFLVG